MTPTTTDHPNPQRPPAPARRCAICTGPVESPDPTVDYCRSCWYSGAELQRRRPFLRRLVESFGCERANLRAEIYHSGGGCFGLRVTVHSYTPAPSGGGRVAVGPVVAVLYGTAATKDEAGTWTCEAELPATDGDHWCVGYYGPEGPDEAGAMFTGLAADRFVTLAKLLADFAAAGVRLSVL